MYSGKYGIFDGFYWVQALPDRGRQVRFLEGYLYSHRRDPKSAERYSRTADEYARLIHDVFSKPEPDLNVGIGEVLATFRDK